MTLSCGGEKGWIMQIATTVADEIAEGGGQGKEIADVNPAKGGCPCRLLLLLLLVYLPMTLQVASPLFSLPTIFYTVDYVE